MIDIFKTVWRFLQNMNTTTAVYMVQKSYYGISIQWEEKSVWEEV